MRPSQSVNFGQMSVVVMGSSGVGEIRIMVNISEQLIVPICRENKSPSHCFNKLFSQRLHSHPV